jgi:PAS domain S-box-containing protein
MSIAEKTQEELLLELQELRKEHESLKMIYHETLLKRLANEEENILLAAALRNINECVTITDENNIIIFINDTFIKVYGFEREELLGQNISIVSPINKDKNINGSILSATLLGGWHGELVNRKKDGTEFPIFLSTAIMEQSVSKQKLLIGIAVDITERKKTDEELEESREKYRGLSEAAFEAIFISEKGVCIEQNITAENMFGYSSEEAIGCYGTMWIVPGDREIVMKNMVSGYEEPYEVTALRKDGSTFPCSLRGKMMRFKGRNVRVTSLTDITERKQAEASLKISEEFNKRIVDTANEGIWVIDKNQISTFANKKMAEMLGMSIDEIIGTSLSGYIFPEDIISHYEQMELRKSGKSTIYERRYKRKDGTEIWTMVSTSVILDHNGIFSGSFAMISDISESKKAEDTLKEINRKQEYLLEALDNCGTYIFIKDINSRYIYANKLSRELFDRPIDEIIGKTDEAFFPMDNAIEMKNYDNMILSSGEIIKKEQTVFHKNKNESRTHWVIKLPLQLPDGTIHGICGISTDITEIKKTEENIRIFADLIDISPLSISVHDLEGNTLYANQKTLDMHGYSKDEFLSLNLKDIDAPVSAELIQLRMQKIMETGEASFEVEHYRKDGTCFPLEVFVKLTQWGKKNVVLSIASDITDRKKAEENLLKLNNAIENSREVVFITNREGIITYMNVEFTKMYGYSPDEVIGKVTPRILKSGYNSEEVINYFWKALLNKQKLFGEYINQTKDGRYIDVEGSADPIMNDTGEIIGFMGIHRDITQRKRAEEQIKNNELKLRTVANYTYDWEYWENENNLIEFISPSCERTTGYSQEEFIADPLLIEKIVHHDDKELMYIHHNMTFTQNESDYVGNLEFRIIKKDGSIVNIDHICRPIFDAENKYRGRRVSNRDITERKQTEESLKKSEEKYRELVQNSPDAIVIHINGKFVFVNNACVQMLAAKNEDELLGRNIIDFVHPDYKDFVKNRMIKAIKEGKPLPLAEEKYIRLDGEFIDIELKPIPIIYDNQKAVMVITRDITAQKKAKEALLESEERFRNLSNLLPQVVFETDIFGTLIFANQIAYDLFGYSQEDFNNGKKAYELLIPEDREIAIPRIKAVLNNNGTSKFEYTALRKDGTTFPVIVYSNSIIRNNQISGLRGIVFDITELKRAEDEIKQLNIELESRVEQRTAELQNTLEKLQDTNIELKLLNDQVIDDTNRILKLNDELMDSQDKLKDTLAAKDKFFSIIAHDLKNPFTGFLILSEMLARNYENLSVIDMKKMAQSINDAANSMFRLLDDLLMWARSQMGSIPFQPEELDIREIVLNTQFSLKSTAENKQIKLISLIDKSYFVNCDRNMITSVLRNLVSNSIKFTNENGNIEIGIIENQPSEGLKPSEGYIIYVKDTGIGISESNLSKLFRLDEHYTTSGTNKEKGTGLGLILCKEFVEKHGGKIWIESEVGKGSTFYFSL